MKNLHKISNKPKSEYVINWKKLDDWNKEMEELAVTIKRLQESFERANRNIGT